MGQVQARKPQMGLTFEDVWAMFQETDKKFQKTDRKFQKDREQQAEWKKQHDERKKEHDREMEKLHKLQEETWRIVKENARQMGDLHNRFGELAEHLVAPSIADKFNEMGFHFDSVAPGGEKITDGNKKILAEVDIVLRNSDYIVAVEVKSRPVLKDIPEHIKRLEILRAYWTNKGDKRKLRGAVAGAIFPKNVKEAAIKAGLYVLVQSGDTMKIDIPDGFKARDW